MRTRITDLLGIRHPIILAPANYVGTPEMVAAVSSAGGFGILLASGRLAPDDLQDGHQGDPGLTDKPFGANLIFGSPGFEKQAEILIRSRGPPDLPLPGQPQVDHRRRQGPGHQGHGHHGFVKHAIGRKTDGAHAVMVQGSEAGGHVGEVSPWSSCRWWPARSGSR